MMQWMNPKTRHRLYRLPVAARNYVIRYYMEGCVVNFETATPNWNDTPKKTKRESILLDTATHPAALHDEDIQQEKLYKTLQRRLRGHRTTAADNIQYQRSPHHIILTDRGSQPNTRPWSNRGATQPPPSHFLPTWRRSSRPQTTKPWRSY